MKKETDKSITVRCEVVERRVIKPDQKTFNQPRNVSQQITPYNLFITCSDTGDLCILLIYQDYMISSSG